MKVERYNVYSEYLYKKYGCKVYKLPVNLYCSCPNRDGVLGYGGCIYCGEKGAGFESLPNIMPVKEQLLKNMEYISRKYKAEKYIAYFQNYSNTYIDLNMFKYAIEQACIDRVVEISVSTRPDCINERYLEYLKELSTKRDVSISIELGLQTVNYHTLKTINRGHTLGEFIDAVMNIKKYGFLVCAHLILDLPWDDMDDVIEDAKVLSALKIDQVKLHSLYIVKGTVLSDMYLKGEFVPVTMDEYIKRVVAFLEYLDPSIVIQRLIGRAPKEDTVFANWNTSWWKVKDKIDEELKRLDTYQGRKFNYLNGKALKHKNFV